MPAPKQPLVESDRRYRRIKSLADGIFAFAITLLAIDIRVPEIFSDLATAIFNLIPRFISFLITFWIVATYWLAYHRLMSYIIRYDRTLVSTTFLFLMFVVLLPFPADLIGRYPTQLPSLLTAAVFFAATGIAPYLIWHHATHNHRLVDPKLSPRLIRRISLQYLSSPAVFLASIPIIYYFATTWGILVAFIWVLVVPLHTLIDRHYRRQ